MTFTILSIWFKRNVARNLCSHSQEKVKCLMLANRLSDNVFLGRYDAACFA